MKFHVGQRVRIVRPNSDHLGCSATVVEIVANRTLIDHKTGERIVNATSHRVDVDGVGIWSRRGNRFGFIAADLEPIPDSTELGTWEQVQAICGFKPNTVQA